jgi:murein L,D-transpeptidase YcbB/YkuD
VTRPVAATCVAKDRFRVTKDPLFLVLITFALTTVGGGGLTYAFQRSAWRHQYRVQREDARREQAMRTFEEVSRLLDQRLYRMRQVYWPRFGDKGERVRRLQRALTVPADGHFGRDTEKALRAFQTSAGLRADGVAGPDTLSALDDI